MLVHQPEHRFCCGFRVSTDRSFQQLPDECVEGGIVFFCVFPACRENFIVDRKRHVLHIHRVCGHGDCVKGGVFRCSLFGGEMGEWENGWKGGRASPANVFLRRGVSRSVAIRFNRGTGTLVTGEREGKGEWVGG